ncbi:MAG: glycosyl transferase [Fibrobacteraceae bacterium]|nr:glycosyl transferase [Fibrobacteraceae bacterium]
MAIPKHIHYCWLSEDPYTTLVQHCINSWIVQLPDYEITLWNSKNFDTESIPWVHHAIQNKKWAFAADYIRLYALYNYGGIYLDSDVEVFKTFNDLLHHPYFMCYEKGTHRIEAAILGFQPYNDLIKKCLHYYESHDFNQNEIIHPITIPFLFQRIIKKDYHINYLSDGNPFSKESDTINIFPSEYFSPKSYQTKETKITSKSYCLHHFEGAWMSPYEKEYHCRKARYKQKYGGVIAQILCFVYSFKMNYKKLGILGILKKTFRLWQEKK